MSGLPVLIGGSEVDELLRYQDLVPRLEAALGQFSSRTGEVVQPVRTILPLEKYSGYLGVMPAYIPQDDVLATKMVSFYQRGPGWEGHHGQEDGGRFRDRDQAPEAGPGRRAVPAGRGEPGAQPLRGPHPDVPLQRAVGACRPDWRELDDALMRSAVVYVDSREGAAQESGDIILSGAEVFAELGEVLNGAKPALREQTTVFKSLGMGVQDAVSAKLVFDGWKARH